MMERTQYRGYCSMGGRASAVLALLAALLAGCAPAPEPGAPAVTPRNVRVLDLAADRLDEYFELSGTMAPVRGTEVAAEEGGTVAALPHDKGDHIQAGAVLVELDRRLLAAEVAAARANIELAEYNDAQTRALFAAGKVSEIQALTARTQADQARAALQVAQLRYDRAAIKAPFAGLVADRYVEPGQLVAPGQPVARIIDPHVLKLTGAMSEREAAWLRLDASAQVWIDGHGAPLPGRVAWLAFEADVRTGKFPVEVHVDNGALVARAGVVGRARVVKKTHDNVIVIPRDAVLETRRGHDVYVVDGDRARRRPVELGQDQGLMVVVTSGLRAGDQLVVRGHRDLVEDALVRITERATARDGGLPADPAAAREFSAAPRGGQEGALP